MEVMLPGGHAIQIDEEDAPLLERFRCRVDTGSGGRLRVIAIGQREPDGQRVVVALSHLILQSSARRPVFHENGNPLDLRRANLRAGGRYCCPFSPERLRALYQDERQRYPEIAQLAADAAGWAAAPSPTTVKQWLREAGIPLHPYGQRRSHA